ncbi:MAG: DEAD/DEAH box helicase [Elusimicrobia bacterium]|nr:DEAD/DEAH box helicase [Elusimicrobiota bacterium]
MNPVKVEKNTRPIMQKTEIRPTIIAPLKFLAIEPATILKMFQSVSTLQDSQLFIEYNHLNIQGGNNELLCLGEIKGIEKYWYQIETVKKALKYFHGRVLLADEVGLGKTIEAGMLLKEYLLRGMVKNILILVPTSLVSQWREELSQKFGLEFVTTDDPVFQADPDKFWKKRFIIASINTAKGSRNFAKVVSNYYDLVVVDEGHHLKNRKTLAWQLVNQIKKRFIFILTATPVQNNLIELFNLITLLKPGQFKTERLFRQEYMQKKAQPSLLQKDKLKTLLRDVMIRNTRSVIDLKLPKRYAATLRLEPDELEKQVYDQISILARESAHSLSTPMVQLLLREAGSSPFALKDTLLKLNHSHSNSVANILEIIGRIKDLAKGQALSELLLKNPAEKKVIFTQYLKSMEYVMSVLEKNNLPFVEFRGGMKAGEKDEAITRFKSDIPILLSTESGGEGRNLQFCNTIINFDLPWNPLRIEQRIGRLHRIGQTREVFIFNLSVKNTLEDYMLNILENKLNLFEMIIGEIEPILGYLGEDKEFEEIIFAIWLRSGSQGEINSSFEALGTELIKAKTEYLKSAELDREIFGEDYEV